MVNVNIASNLTIAPPRVGRAPGSLLAGKNVLVTGVLTRTSLAFEVARLAQEQGAAVLLSSFGKRRRLTEATARHLPAPAPVLELDVTNEGDLAALSDSIGEHIGELNGVVHAISGGSHDLMGGGFLDADWPTIQRAMEANAFSLKSLAMACRELMPPGSGIVGVTFDAAKSWPLHDWMGVSKAAYESIARYLARYLGAEGIRVNLVSGAPTISPATAGIPGFEDAQAMIEGVLRQRAPLGWDLTDREPTARAIVALLSDWFPATTGAIIHVDGGMHSTGG
ncbi:enoyl-ACP reductase FabI [Microbacterium laevaniformans]|uniref:enoyl-ACP reductase FabI n=1 Tax=Microbacterium laevaniformans TaxID=36807 RepID=UPI003D98A93F